MPATVQCFTQSWDNLSTNILLFISKIMYVSLDKLAKGPSKNVNIFMSVQTVHLFRPPPPSPPSVQTNIFGFQNMGFTHNIYCATTKINPYFKPV